MNHFNQINKLWKFQVKIIISSKDIDKTNSVPFTPKLLTFYTWLAHFEYNSMNVKSNYLKFLEKVYHKIIFKVGKFQNDAVCISWVIWKKLIGGMKISPPRSNRVNQKYFLCCLCISITGIMFSLVHRTLGVLFFF